MGFNSSLRTKIRRITRELEEKISIEDIFASPELKKNLLGLSSSLLPEGSVSEIDIVKGDKKKDPVAYTCKNYMYLNYNNELLDYYKNNLEAKFVAFMGMFFHEKAHDVYLDFDAEEKAIKSLEEGKFYGKKPENLTLREEKNWEEMENALKDEISRPIFTSIFHNLSNVLSDCHDEEAIIAEYGSFVGEPIYTMQATLRESFPLFEDDFKKMKAENELSFFFNLLLQYARFDTILCKNWDNVVNNKYGQMLLDLEDHLLIARCTDDTSRKYYEMHYIMLALWPLIKAAINTMRSQNQNGSSSQGQSGSSSQGQSGSSSQGQNGSSSQGQNVNSNMPQPLTKEEVEAILKQLNSNANPKAAAPQGKSSAIAKQRRKGAKANPKQANQAAEETKKKHQGQNKTGRSNETPNENAISSILKKIAKAIAEEKAETEVEKECTSDTLITVKSANANSIHASVPLNCCRATNVSETNIATYNAIMNEVGNISKRLQRKIFEALRDVCNGYTAKHKLYGKIFCPEDTYRPDGRCFANKKQPEDLPDMAINVLVDNSGSMSGIRLKTAIKACVLLHDFATAINIPVAVCGHTTSSGNAVKFTIFADFEKISKNDKYRICNMEASGCNRDGMALNIAAAMLAKRPEKAKLLIIISDGQPNHHNYGGEAAEKDIQNIVKSAKHKDIEIIAAAIGDDRDNINRIYGDTYLDISELDKLPKVLTEIVKKRVINNI